VFRQWESSWWEFLGNFTVRKRDLLSEACSSFIMEGFVLSRSGERGKLRCWLRSCSGETAAITASAWASVKQWDNWVAEGAPLSLGCYLVLRLDCTALLRPPVPACCLNQK